MAEIKHPSYDYMYQIKTLHHFSDKKKPWVVYLVREVGLTDKGIKTATNQRSFVTKEEAMVEYSKYQAKVHNIVENGKMVSSESFVTEKEKAEKQELTLIFCPNMLGVGLGAYEDMDMEMVKALRGLKDEKGFISMEDAKKAVAEYKANLTPEPAKEASSKKWWKFW